MNGIDWHLFYVGLNTCMSMRRRLFKINFSVGNNGFYNVCIKYAERYNFFFVIRIYEILLVMYIFLAVR